MIDGIDMSVPFVVDRPDFAALRPDVREMIVEAELVFRKAMEELVSRFPAHLAGGLQGVITETPARFMVGMLPFFREHSELMDFAEIIKLHLAKEAGRPC